AGGFALSAAARTPTPAAIPSNVTKEKRKIFIVGLVTESNTKSFIRESSVEYSWQDGRVCFGAPSSAGFQPASAAEAGRMRQDACNTSEQLARRVRPKSKRP